MSDFTIIVDTREQLPWDFEEHTVAKEKLDTGDYSVKGLEDILCIERKRSVSEIANNLTEKRFDDVLSRMSKYKFAFLLLEFSVDDILSFPIGSDIPKRMWDKIKISPNYIIARMLQMSYKYNIHVIYCGGKGNAEIYAMGLMKKIHKQYGQK